MKLTKTEWIVFLIAILLMLALGLLLGEIYHRSLGPMIGQWLPRSPQSLSPIL